MDEWRSHPVTERLLMRWDRESSWPIDFTEGVALVRVAGRAVLWNSAQLRMRADERPRGWSDPWPIPPETVDLILAPADDPIHALLDADPVNRWADRAPPPRGDCGGCAGTFTHRLRAKRPRGG
jgi:hypothetical protein